MNKQTQLLLSSWKNYKTVESWTLRSKMRREEYIVVFTTQLILDNYCILYLLNYAHSLAAFHYSVPYGARPTFHGQWIQKRSPVELPTGARQAVGFLPISKRRSPTPSLYKPFPFLSVHQSDLNRGPIHIKTHLLELLSLFCRSQTTISISDSCSSFSKIKSATSYSTSTCNQLCMTSKFARPAPLHVSCDKIPNLLIDLLPF